jgi:DnaJ-class molecular chaperone
MQKYLQILGLDPRKQYTPQEIKEAWRKKCLEVHPDMGGTDEAFREVTHAYNYLTDPSYRETNREVNVKEELSLKMTVPISFEEGFFGKMLKLNYNQLYKEGDGVTNRDPIEIISLNLQIPAGTCGPSEFIVHGKGIKSADGTVAGDAFITILVNPHKKFRVMGRDVYAMEVIPLEMMLCGGTITVETMYGLEEVKIRPGTMPEQQYIVPRKGVSKLGAHVVIIKHTYPTEAELKNNPSWKGLNIKWGEDVREHTSRD